VCSLHTCYAASPEVLNFPNAGLWDRPQKHVSKTKAEGQYFAVKEARAL